MDDYERLREFEPANRERDGFWFRVALILVATPCLFIVLSVIASL